MLVSLAQRSLTAAALEQRTQEIGRELFARVGRGPAPWERSWWDDHLMNLTMGDPKVKVQLFRFTDVLPVLKTPEDVRDHLEDYLREAGSHVPWWMRGFLALVPHSQDGARLLAAVARRGAMHMASRFIAGETPAQALESVRRLRRNRLAFTADLLGEAVISEREADAYQHTCLELLNSLACALDQDREIPQIDRGPEGPIPRVNLSLKLTSLTARFDPLHAHQTADRVRARLRPIFETARRLRAFVNVDMEQFAYKDLTLDIVRSVLSEPDFRDWPHVGLVIQAYLPVSEDDLRSLLAWVEERGTPVNIRLVKGAYWDYEVLFAQQVGWAVPVYLKKWGTDACFERCTSFLMEHHRWLRPAFGSHNMRSLAHGMAAAGVFGVPDDAYEIQMLYGMGEPIQRALVGMGKRVRIYTPYGAMLPGMAYLVRRLLENTSNESFLKARFTEHARVEDLLRDPEEIGTMWLRNHHPTLVEKPAPSGLAPFTNEPPTDFSRPDARAAMEQALYEVKGKLGKSYPLLIGGREVRTADELVSTDPGNSAAVVAQTARARAAEAAEAIATAHAARESWARTPAAARAEVLQRTAAIFRTRRFELAAWEVYECGKPWREADADVAEAIDFCEFYAREMLRLAPANHWDVAGETNAHQYLPRGVAVVIPPWNFPLAIPTGLTVAAIVTGNTAILKPAEQSPVMGWHLVQTLRQAGLPPEVLSYLPGRGEEAGQALVDDPRVSIIAFTGSRPVGLGINRRAAEPKPTQDHVKRVIAEMGGKNAIIIDDDADLDEAVVGVLHSAFGYSGQKCSACSRVIALEGIYDAFLSRLVEAAGDLPIGQASDPDTVIGPLIDGDARDRVLQYSQLAHQEGRVVLDADPGPLVMRGNFVGPVIVADVDPRARVAQEEIFGPILAVLQARDLDHALEIANGTDYALTGGVYSRRPEHIECVKRKFLVGNLYVNRPITGALVGRQPFGGFKLSGIGTKAGGTDYLHEFLLPRTITENTMRRGFAPDLEATATASAPT